MSEFRRNMVVIFVAVLVFAPLLWMLFDRDPPYTFEAASVEPPVARPGQEVELHFTIKPRRVSACNPGVAYRELKEESGKLHVFDPITRRTFPEITDNRFHRMMRLPDNLASGKVTYRGGVCYTCNVLHAWLRWPVCVKAPDVEFTVVK